MKALLHPSAHVGRTHPSLGSRAYQRSTYASVQRPLRHGFNAEKFRRSRAEEETLVSVETAAEVRKHFEDLTQRVSQPAQSSGKLRLLRAQDQLISAETAAEVRKHFESLAQAVSRPAPSGENAELRSPVNCADAARGGVLSIAPNLYREYADDLKKMAKTATNEHQRVLYLKMANAWKFAAIRFEAGLQTT